MSVPRVDIFVDISVMSAEIFSNSNFNASISAPVLGSCASFKSFGFFPSQVEKRRVF